MYWYNSTFLILIPGILLAIYAQVKINNTYAKYKKIANNRGMTGFEAARTILDANGRNDVQIQTIGGTLSDNYNPTNRVLSLSQDIYRGTSVAAISIAAHECGHAIQHQENYGPIRVRSMLVPIVNFASRLSWILIIVGCIFAWSIRYNTYSDLGYFLIILGIIFFAATVLFQLVTLPVEFNASGRALAQMESLGLATDSEIYGAKKVLDAAALTYVAATIVAILQLLRIVLLFGGRRN